MSAECGPAQADPAFIASSITARISSWEYLNSTVSGHFLFTAGIGHRQRLRLASEHKQLLTELIGQKTSSVMAAPTSDQEAVEVTTLRDKVA